MSRFLSSMLPRTIFFLMVSVLASVLLAEPAWAGWPGSTFRLTVDVSPEQGGDIQIDTVIPESYPDISNQTAGTALELTAMPAPGYAFVEWGGDVNGNNESTTLVISCNTTVTAIFYRVQPTIAWWWPFVGIGAIGVMLLSYLLFIRKDSTPGNLPI